MPIVFAGLMCHAPIVIPAVGRSEADRCARTTRAMREVAQRAVRAAPDRVVLISPHSPRARTSYLAWNGQHRGSLRDFGAPQIAVDLPDAPEVARQLGLGHIRDGQPLDHGAMVPLAFLWEAGWRGPTAILALPWEPAGAEALGRQIAVLSGPTALIASGDMSHRLIPGAPAGYDPNAKAFDAAFVAALRANDRQAAMHPPFQDEAAEDVVESTAVALGAVELDAEVLSYEGPWGVGYTEAILHDPQPPLYAVARRAIRAHLEGRAYTPPSGGPPAAPVFVTLLQPNGDLRGCIGTLRATRPTRYAEVAWVAPDSATADPRFPAVSLAELDDLRIEVSSLDPAQPVGSPAELDPKVWGVIAHGPRGQRGLLLPDIDGVDTVERQLDIVRRKAGIPRDAEVRYEKFTVTKESSP